MGKESHIPLPVHERAGRHGVFGRPTATLDSRDAHALVSPALPTQGKKRMEKQQTIDDLKGCLLNIYRGTD